MEDGWSADIAGSDTPGRYSSCRLKEEQWCSGRTRTPRNTSGMEDAHEEGAIVVALSRGLARHVV